MGLRDGASPPLPPRPASAPGPLQPPHGAVSRPLLVCPPPLITLCCLSCPLDEGGAQPHPTARSNSPKSLLGRGPQASGDSQVVAMGRWPSLALLRVWVFKRKEEQQVVVSSGSPCLKAAGETPKRGQVLVRKVQKLKGNYQRDCKLVFLQANVPEVLR